MTGRTSFHFPREAAEQLIVIKARTVLDSYPNIIRAALHSYDTLLQLAEAGCQLVVVRAGDAELAYSPYRKFSYPELAQAMAAPAEGNPDEVPRNFFFNGEAAQNLESIKRRSFLKSNADALRVALASYKELLLIYEIGDRILVRGRSREEEFTPYRPFPLETMLGAATRQRQTEDA